MAKCDEGYMCQVCGQAVTSIFQSSLYLRFVIGQVPPELLHTYPERHLRCDPELAQFIVCDQFEPVTVDGRFDKRQVDPDARHAQEQLVTRGWLRLQELRTSRPARITDYPLPEVRARWEQAEEDRA